jgi:vesicle coat complex subunit
MRNILCHVVVLQVTPVSAGLDDRHPYVRRTAVMGVLKIWHMNPGGLLAGQRKRDRSAECVSAMLEAAPPAASAK